MIIFLSITALLLLAWFGAPLFTLILSVAMLGFIHQEIDLTVIPIEIYRLTNTPLLLALPLFTLAGYVKRASNTSQRIVRLSMALLCWLTGELAQVTLIASEFINAFTGATGVTIVAICSLHYPCL